MDGLPFADGVLFVEEAGLDDLSAICPDGHLRLLCEAGRGVGTERPAVDTFFLSFVEDVAKGFA